jgi:hypothetical protein
MEQPEPSRQPVRADPVEGQGQQAPAGSEHGQRDGELQPRARRQGRGGGGDTPGGARREQRHEVPGGQRERAEAHAEPEPVKASRILVAGGHGHARLSLPPPPPLAKRAA